MVNLLGCFGCIEKQPTKYALNLYPSFSMGGNLVTEYGINEPITSNYELSQTVLGRGSSAEVVIGTHKKTHRRYAVKVIDGSKKYIQWRYEREVNILKDLDHINIVRLLEVYSSKYSKYLVMELCTGGHLGVLLKQCGHIDPDIALSYTLQLCKAVAHCHENGICHRDIKMQNILLESNGKDAQIKLVDFGNSARYKGHLPMTKIVGTTYTAAPEVFREEYDERCDIWSIGVVTYILLSGKRPFEPLSACEVNNTNREREKAIIAAILVGKYNFRGDVWNDISKSAMHFVQCCLEHDYRSRPSAADLLYHNWLSDGQETVMMGSKSSINTKALKSRLNRSLISSGLRRASMLAVAFVLPPQKLLKVRSIFQSFDKNGTGKIDKDDFYLAMLEVSPMTTRQDSNSLFEMIDQDGNNCIGFIEFVACMVDPREVDIEELNQAFNLLDKEKKGFISNTDIYRLLSTTDNIPSSGNNNAENERENNLQKKVDDIIKSGDTDGDGRVSHAEFLFAMADPLKKAESASKIGRSEQPSRSTNTTISQSRRQSDSFVSLSGKSFRKKSLLIPRMPINGKSDQLMGTVGTYLESLVSRLSSSFRMSDSTYQPSKKDSKAVDRLEDDPVIVMSEDKNDVNRQRVRRNTSPASFLSVRRNSIMRNIRNSKIHVDVNQSQSPMLCIDEDDMDLFDPDQVEWKQQGAVNLEQATHIASMIIKTKLVDHFQEGLKGDDLTVDAAAAPVYLQDDVYKGIDTNDAYSNLSSSSHDSSRNSKNSGKSKKTEFSGALSSLYVRLVNATSGSSSKKDSSNSYSNDDSSNSNSYSNSSNINTNDSGADQLAEMVKTVRSRIDKYPMQAAIHRIAEDTVTLDDTSKKDNAIKTNSRASARRYSHS